MIMEGDPYLLIEGMILAGYAVGASEGYIYLRAEYPHLWDVLKTAVEKARERGYLGKKIEGSDFSFDIKLFRGAGAYVCGEETALLESLEGKRGHPRRKPPYPAQSGLWGKPTVVNNVETLAYVPLIVKNGVDWFRSLGTEKSPGTKIFTVIGRVKHPGAYEIEMGTPLSTLLFDYAGADREEFKGALVGGAAGVVVDDSFLDVKMDFESLEERGALLGSGAILVFNKDDCVVDILHSVLHFFKHESCGKCAPCRLGTQALFEIIEEIRYGEACEEDIDKMVEIAETMRDAAYCPLGQFVILPVKSAIDRFRGEIEKHLDPQFACKKCWR
jgi:NADH:ubiquinone oxidoreductase subunit F (NADH-binding)